jgi:hypothetical protein
MKCIKLHLLFFFSCYDSAKQCNTKRNKSKHCQRMKTSLCNNFYFLFFYSHYHIQKGSRLFSDIAAQQQNNKL